MISLTRLNGQEIVVNAELIEYMEATPQVVITLTTGRRIMVEETLDQVVAATISYRNSILRGRFLQLVEPGRP